MDRCVETEDSSQLRSGKFIRQIICTLQVPQALSSSRDLGRH